MRELERKAPTTDGADRAPLPPLAIIGAGRVGGSLATAARRAGIEVTLAGRDNAAEAHEGARAALLCVPDDAIAAAALTAAAAVPPLELVGHVSGSTGLGALEPVTRAGAEVFSIHPLQTVPDPRTELSGAPCAISGSGDRALGFARALALELGMDPFEIPDEHRALYHAAACVASNFLVTLEQSATQLLERAGGADARELLAPLVLRTAANWSERGAEALTGPIARGDRETIERHLEALRESAPELVDLYQALAERTAELARERR